MLEQCVVIGSVICCLLTADACAAGSGIGDVLGRDIRSVAAEFQGATLDFKDSYVYCKLYAHREFSFDGVGVADKALIPYSLLATTNTYLVYSVVCKKLTISSGESLSCSNVVRRFGKQGTVAFPTCDFNCYDWIVSNRMGDDLRNVEVVVRKCKDGSEDVAVSVCDCDYAFGGEHLRKKTESPLKFMDAISKVCQLVVCPCARHRSRPIRPTVLLDRYFDVMKDQKFDWMFEGQGRTNVVCGLSENTYDVVRRDTDLAELPKGISTLGGFKGAMTMDNFLLFSERAQVILGNIDTNSCPQELLVHVSQKGKLLSDLRGGLLAAKKLEQDLVRELKWPWKDMAKIAWKSGSSVLKLDVGGFKDAYAKADEFDCQRRDRITTLFKELVDKLEEANELWQCFVDVEQDYALR